MRKFNYLLSCVALGAVLTSCSKDELEVITPEGVTNFTITATESKETVSLDSKAAITGLNFAWEAQDFLRVSSWNSYTDATKTFRAQSSGNPASFTGDFTSDNPLVMLVAAYGTDNGKTFVKPFSVADNGTDATWETYPERIIEFSDRYLVQDHKYGENNALLPSEIGNYTYMYGSSPVTETNATSVSMKMKHVMSLFDFQLSGLPTDQTIDSLKLTASKDIFPARLSAKFFTSPTPVEIFSMNQPAYIGNTIMAVLKDKDGNIGVTPIANTPLAVRLAVPMGLADMNYEDLTLTIETYSGGKVLFTEVKTPTKLYEAGKQYDAPITYIAPTQGATITKTADQPIDLTGIEGAKELTIDGAALNGDDFALLKKMPYLETLDISNTVTTAIPASTFAGTTSKPHSLSKISLPTSLTTISASAFSWSLLESITVPSAVTLANYVFQSCKRLTIITLQEGTKFSGSGIFNGCSSLRSINGDNDSDVNLKTIGTSLKNSMFQNCSSLTSINLLNSGLTTMNNSIFSGCTKLSKITLPIGLKSIGYVVFNSCSSLTTLTFPDTFESMNYAVFNGCNKLTTITFQNETALTYHNNVTETKPAFDKNAITEIFVPTASFNAYKTALTTGGYTGTVTGQ